MGANNIAETLELIKAAQAAPVDGIEKSFTQPGTATTGLQAYNLEAPAKLIVPVLTPLRNAIARVTGGFSIQANWKSITNVNASNLRAGVSEGQRGGVLSHTTTENFAAFRGYGMEDFVTFEADYAGQGFEDVKARAVQLKLAAMMIEEEKLILGGSTSLALGTTPTPTLSAGAGGALAAMTLSVVCVALNFAAYWDVVGANNGTTGQQFNAASAFVPHSITRTNADGSSDTFGGGSARKSAAATVVVTAGQKVTASVAPVRGAYGYAWFWGAAGAEVLGGVSSTSSFEILSAATGAQTAASLPAADNSTSALEFDGLLTQIVKPGSGGYYFDAAGATLTSDGAGGINEIEAALLSFWNLYRLSPQSIMLSGTDLVKITKLIVSNGGAPLLKLNANAQNPGALQAGVVVGSYLNKVTGQDIPLVVHPNMPVGTLMFFSTQTPNYLSNTPNLVRMLMRREYYQIAWPLRTRKYEYGVYADGVLQMYFPAAFGVITNFK